MKEKLTKKVQDKTKDFGLTQKAIEDLIATSIEGLKSDATDEEIEKVADSLANFAKIMQGEITRKMSKKADPKPKEEPKPEPKPTPSADEPEWFRIYREANEKAIAELKQQNAAFAAEQAKAERGAKISQKAKELGIPDFLMKHVSIADDADFETELTAFKQELVTNSLMSEDSAKVKVNAESAIKDDAKAWASKLPSN